MPQMTGAELLTEVNSLGLDPARILLTGYSDMELHRRDLKRPQKATARIFYNLLSLSGQLGGNRRF